MPAFGATMSKISGAMRAESAEARVVKIMSKPATVSKHVPTSETVEETNDSTRFKGSGFGLARAPEHIVI